MDTVAVIGACRRQFRGRVRNSGKGNRRTDKRDEMTVRSRLLSDEVFKKAAVYESSFQVQMLKAQNAENYSSASETAESDEDFVWISDIFREDLSRFKAAAKINGGMGAGRCS